MDPSGGSLPTRLRAGAGVGLVFGLTLAAASVAVATLVLRRSVGLTVDPLDGATLRLAAGTVGVCAIAGVLVAAAGGRALDHRPGWRLHALLPLFLAVVAVAGEPAFAFAGAMTVGLGWLGAWAALAVGRRWPRAAWGAAGALALGMAGAAGARARSPAAPPVDRPAGTRSPDVLWVVLDTVRADHVSTAGYARDTTPRLAALAAEARVYERAYAPAAWTLPSHASMLTGLYPDRHACTDETLFLDPAFPTAAEHFAARGYRTALFSGNPWVGAATGLDRGFAHVFPAWGAPTLGGWFPAMLPFARWADADKGADATGRAFADWLDAGAADAPVFAFVNLLEAHVPYHELAREDREVFAEARTPDALAASRRYAQFLMIAPDGPPPDAAERARLVALYDAGVRAADRHLGALLDALAARGRLDDTLVIVASDHGESFGEGGRWEHRALPGEEVLHVPLVVRAPGGTAARVTTPVSLVDLLPTALAETGAALPDDLDGRPLPAADTPDAAGRALFAEVHPPDGGVSERRLRAWGWEPARFRWRLVQRDGRRFVRGPDGDHLYALAAPDVALEDPATAGALAELLRGEAAAPRRAAPPVDDETKRRLEALGYAE